MPPTVAPAVPASPFMAVDQAATVLRVKPLLIQRAIALGNLKAFRTQPESPWNIRPADLEAYAESKFAGLQIPPLSPEGSWYDDRDSSFFHKEFTTQARAAIEAVIPETPPEGLMPNGSESVRLFAADSGIRSLAQKPQLQPAFKIPGLKLPSSATPGNSSRRMNCAASSLRC